MYIKKGAITADRSVLAYIRFDVGVPDEDRRQIAQKNVEGANQEHPSTLYILLTFVRF